MNQSHEHEPLEAIPPELPVSRDQLCRQCRIDTWLLEELVQHGVVEPHGSDGFRQAHVVRITRAVRVMHEFEVGIDNLALVVDLLDALQAQRREIELLRRVSP